MTVKRKSRRDVETEAGSLHEAVIRNRANDVRKIVKKGNVDVDARDSDGYTPFALACRQGNVG